MTSARQAEEPMTSDAFLAWYDAQPHGPRYELLDGLPFAMSAERMIHIRVKVEVRNRLAADITRKGIPCEAIGDGAALRIDDRNVFEPDVTVRCGPRLSSDDVIVEDPSIVVEVAPPSTQRIDAFDKFARYFRNPHVAHNLIVLPTKRLVVHHRRTADNRIESVGYEQGTIHLDPPGLDLSIDTPFDALNSDWNAMRRRPLAFQRNREPKGALMGLFTKDIKTMDDLFIHQLKDVYYAEKRIEKTLPKMASKASTPELKQGFERHLAETQTQISRLEQVFENNKVKPDAVTCPAIDGIIKEAEEVAGDVADKRVLDAALIASAQAVEHYEIARYGTLVAWAKQLGKTDCASQLQKNLDEERRTNDTLTQLATGQVNKLAA